MGRHELAAGHKIMLVEGLPDGRIMSGTLGNASVSLEFQPSLHLKAMAVATGDVGQIFNICVPFQSLAHI